MKSFFIIFTLSLFLGGTVSAKTLNIGVDVSKPSFILKSPQNAAMAANLAWTEVMTLEKWDTVHVKLIGSRNSGRNMAGVTYRITPKLPAKAVAKTVADFIANLHRTEKGDSQSNLLAYFEAGSSFGCDASGSILVFSDMVEDSPTLSEKKFLKTGKLPAPKTSLAGCSLKLFGIGASASGRYSPETALRIRAAWQAYAKQAGVTSFTGIIDP